MSAFSKATGILYATLFIAGLWVGCGSESEKDGTLILQSSPFSEIQGRADVTAELKMGGKTCSLIVDADTTLSGQCSGFPLGTHSYALNYRHTLSGVTIARASGTVTIMPGSRTEMTIPSLDKSMDDDEDGYTNLAEVIGGTDPKDPNSPIRLTVTKSGTGGGTVTSSPPGIDCGPVCFEAYGNGTLVTLTADPDVGSTFASWGGDCTGTSTSTTVTVGDASKTCTAAFDWAWTVSTVAIENIGAGGGYTSIALDSADQVHISYYDASHKDLKYATNASGSWAISTIDSAGDVGRHTSLAIDSNGKVHISYYDASNTGLKYATNVSGWWEATMVDDSMMDVGQYTSIALDSADQVHISYYDASHKDLKYATNASGSWAISTIDSAGDVGRHTSLAIDSNDKVHISYYDSDYKALKYANNTGGLWDTSTLDSSGLDSYGSVGRYPSLTVDRAGKIHISYYVSYDDFINGDLKYVESITQNYSVSTIDSVGFGDGYTSIALDSADQVHISYYDASHKDLKYATNASGSWAISTIDSAGDVGRHTSLAIDSNDKVHISYYDGTNNDLKYATNQ